MRFTLKQLRYLHAAGRVGSIAHAAQSLNISQSSVTGALDTIERDLGVTLFKRIPSAGLQPTAVGRDVLTRTARFLAEADNFGAELSAISSGKSGTLHLALYRASARAVINPVLRRFTERHGDTQIEVTEGDLDTLLELLDNSEVDAVLPFRRADRGSHGFLPLFEARPYAVLPRGHPLAARRDVSLEDLVALPMVLLDLPVARDRYIEIFRAKGLDPDVRHTVKTSGVACALVACGFGFSILNLRDPAHGHAASEVAALPIRDDVHAPTYGVAFPAGVTQSHVTQRFLELVTDLAAEGAFENLTVPLPHQIK